MFANNIYNVLFAFLIRVMQIIANTYKLGVIINTNENRNNSEKCLYFNP